MVKIYSALQMTKLNISNCSKRDISLKNVSIFSMCRYLQWPFQMALRNDFKGVFSAVNAVITLIKTGC